MKHLLKKISLVGAGGGGGGSQRPKPPPPAKLEPPKLGIYKPYSSYNQIEIVDLLCDGPIEGLVNPLGRTLESKNIFEGIYLDDTPIATSTVVGDATSEIFNDYNLNAEIAALGTTLDTNVSASETSGNGLFKSFYLSWLKGSLDSVLTNNDNCLFINGLQLMANYQLNWGFHAIGYHAPSIEKSNKWNLITSVSKNRLNEDPQPVFARPANLFFYRNKNFSGLEVHTISTAQFEGIAYDAKTAWESLKNNTSINQYERQIIEKKLALASQTFKTHTQLKNPSAGWWFQSTGGWLFIKISNKFDRTDSRNIGLKSGVTDADKSVVNGDKLIDFGFILKNSGIESSLILDCIIPEIDDNNQFNGKVYGFIGIKLPTATKTFTKQYNSNYTYAYFYKNILTQDLINSLKKVTQLGFTKNIAKTSTSKYNYNNVLCEIKYGESNQKPLNYFSKIYFDTDYKNKLIGPFRTAGEIRRLKEINNLVNPPFPNRSIIYEANTNKIYLDNHGLYNGDEVKINDQAKNATLSAANNTVILNNHPLSNGMKIKFFNLKSGANLSESTTYYVRNVTTNTFQVSTTTTNAVVDIKADGQVSLDLQVASEITSDKSYFVANKTQNAFQLAVDVTKAKAGTPIVNIKIDNSAKLVSISRKSNNPRDGELRGGNPTLAVTSTTTDAEGSNDAERLSAKGSYTEIQQTFDEDAIPITHVIENPETKSVIVTVLVNELTDTLSKQLDIDGYNTDTTSSKMENPGTKIPAVVTILIQTGKDNAGTISNVSSYTYSIYGNIPSACSIDFGNPNNNVSKFNFISQNNRSINEPFILPTLSETDINSEVKRFVKVYKVSAETHSVLIRKEIYLEKVTEIIDSKFSYPHSAIVGTKLDARNQSAIPMRSFDCRLKKIKIPSNYEVIEGGYDIRYQKSKSAYESAGRKLIYNGDWDGTFKIGWTDNPAWILYDILISKRYGLGRYIDESQINVWELYKIGRYCDAVSDNGFYLGVSDGRGGLEPRFSCNVLFNSPTKVFDAINMIANLFRGSVFFAHGEVNFSDDRPKDPIAIFNNSNVKDGIFNYISNKKDDIFNTVEVAYLDRFDNFKTKIELAEDPEDIRKRGVHKTVVNTVGVTSKAMAKRIGQHIIWQTVKENQAIEFVAGLESLFCKPGDLIVIDDELKTRNVNCGRVLEIDTSNRSLRLDNTYNDKNFDGYITLYTPTGFLTKDELYNKAKENRNRLTSFTLNATNSSVKPLNGFYLFSKYDEFGMALYTGYSDSKYNIYCYYDNVDKGWVFSTGRAYQRNNTYDKLITKTVSLEEDIRDKLNKVYVYSLGNQRKGTEIDITSNLTYGVYYAGGIYDNEIITESPRQITKYQISGVSTNVDDGSIVYLNANNFNLNLLSTIEPGSPYRIGMNSFKDEVYKVISVREENQNEYLVVATKYDSGKWSAIENDTVVENPQQIFYSSSFNSRVSSLETPTNLYLDIINESSNNFDITGSFDSSYAGTRDFKITLENKAVGFKYETVTTNKQFSIDDLNDLGKYELTVQVLAARSTEFSSYPAKISKFIGYEKTDVSIHDRPYIENFKII